MSVPKPKGPNAVYHMVIGSKRLPLRSCLLRSGAGEDIIDFTYAFWVVTYNQQIVLIDTGFRSEVAAKRNIAFHRTCLEALHELDLTASDVTDIILTHLHFDHAGSLADFPNARLHLQDSDLEFYTGPYMRFQLCASAIEAADVREVLAARADGRLTCLRGDTTIQPGLSVHHVGGHTPGMQVVTIEGAGQIVVLASDAAHLRANLDRGVPFPVLHDVPSSCTAFEQVAELGKDGVVVPGHDGAVLHDFPQIGRYSAQLL